MSILDKAIQTDDTPVKNGPPPRPRVVGDPKPVPVDVEWDSAFIRGMIREMERCDPDRFVNGEPNPPIDHAEILAVVLGEKICGDIAGESNNQDADL